MRLADLAYLGVDQSYSGLAIVGLGADLTVMHAVEGKFPAARYGQGVDRLAVIYTWLRTNGLPAGNPNGISVEGYSMGSKLNREKMGELGATVKRAVREFYNPPIYPTIVPPTALKKFATGKGNADKKAMLAAALTDTGHGFSSDNLADAYWLARVSAALDGNGLDGDMSDVRATVVSDLRARGHVESERWPKP